uniref:saccharopine dehydrogenase-like oxidoreductase isoform X5 n=2 Tax=Macaca TaxID=9539 RepID=UPI0010A21C88|nr:saccharopine dehydrogenase-like oxidoreductase isoform X5 [Macaca mulatta]
MGRGGRLPGLEADWQPEPPPKEASRPRPPGQAAALRLRRQTAWAWAPPWRGGARGVKRARRWRRRRGGCCAGYWGRCRRRRRRGLSAPRAWARSGLVMATEQRPFHLVVFGASGFTGQFVTEEVAREQVDPERSSRLPWAVAGRSREKLQRVLEKAALKLGRPTLSSEVGIIICDIANPASLDEMAKQATVVLNCVGPGLSIHDGTWKSAIYGFGDQSNLRKLRNASNLKPVPLIGPKLKRRWPISYCRELKGYSIPFMGSDVSVVKRTQRYLYENLEESPVQYAAYVTVGGITSVIKLMFAGLFFLFFVRFGIGRQLLIKFPWFFSFGYFSKQGPTQKQIDAASFTLTFFGQGYSQGLGTDKNKPNIKICTQVKGPEAGYVATPIAMVQAAMTLLNDASDLPKAGGVFTPGAAFSKTKLIDRLNKHGIEFSVISSSEV